MKTIIEGIIFMYILIFVIILEHRHAHTQSMWFQQMI